MSTTDTDYQSFSKVVILTGSSNYAEWERSIQTTLILKDLEIMDPITLTDGSTTDDKANYKRSRQAYALILKSLSSEVQSLLSAKSLCVSTADSLGLWTELKDQYSASVGSHQAQLLQQMWLLPVEEGENPSKRLAEIRSAHAQLNSSGEHLSDQMLAYCMTLALPESFTPIIQSLWLNKPLKSADVQAAIQTEWARRVGTGSTAIANRAQDSRAPPHSRKPKREWHDKWCYHHKSPNHHTRDCPNKPHYQTGNANLVSGVAEKEAEDLGLVLHTTIDGVSLPRDTFVVDSSASHHMVAHESLLQNLNPPSAVKRVKLGDGRIVPVAGQGRTRLGPVTLDKVLLVPDLAFNLIAVNKMPDHLRWSFSTKTADLIDPTTQTKYLSAPWEHNSYLCRKSGI